MDQRSRGPNSYILLLSKPPTSLNLTSTTSSSTSSTPPSSTNPFSSLPFDIVVQELFTPQRIQPHHLFVIRRVDKFFHELISPENIEENPIGGWIDEEALDVIRWDQARPRPCEIASLHLQRAVEIDSLPLLEYLVKERNMVPDGNNKLLETACIKGSVKMMSALKNLAIKSILNLDYPIGPLILSKLQTIQFLGDQMGFKYALHHLETAAVSEHCTKDNLECIYLNIIEPLASGNGPSLPNQLVTVLARSGNVEAIAWAMQHGSTIGEESFYANAAQFGHVHLFALAEANGIYLKDPQWRWLVLAAAVSRGHVEVLKWFVSKGFSLAEYTNDVFPTKGPGWQKPFMMCISRGFYEALEYSLDHGVKPDQHFYSEAAVSGNMRMAELLDRYDCPVDEGVLLKALSSGSRQMVNHLLTKGVAPPRFPFSNYRGVDFLKWLIREKHFNIRKELLPSALSRANEPVLRFCVEELQIPMPLKVWNIFDFTCRPNGGHPKALKYLLEEMKVPLEKAIIYAKAGTLDPRIYANTFYVLFRNGMPMNDAWAERAASLENIELLKWLHLKGCPMNFPRLRYLVNPLRKPVPDELQGPTEEHSPGSMPPVEPDHSGNTIVNDDGFGFSSVSSWKGRLSDMQREILAWITSLERGVQ